MPKSRAMNKNQLSDTLKLFLLVSGLILAFFCTVKYGILLISPLIIYDMSWLELTGIEQAESFALGAVKLGLSILFQSILAARLTAFVKDKKFL